MNNKLSKYNRTQLILRFHPEYAVKYNNAYFGKIVFKEVYFIENSINFHKIN